MKKINKIKKGVVKVFDFSRESECDIPNMFYKKEVGGQKFELCAVCDCVKRKHKDIVADIVEEKVKKVSKRKIINFQKKILRESYLEMLEDAKSNNEWVVPNRMVAQMSNRLDRHIESRMAMRKKKIIDKILKKSPTANKEKRKEKYRVQKTMKLIKEIRSIESGEPRWNWQYRNLRDQIESCLKIFFGGKSKQCVHH